MSDPRNITGEEAFAARCAITPLSFEEKWLHDLFESKENIPPEHTLPKNEAFEEGELPNHQPQRAPVPKSQAPSTLYSIPQWQPPPSARPETTLGVREGPLSRPQLPDPSHSHWQDPRLRSVASNQLARPVNKRQDYGDQNAANTLMTLPKISPIPDVLPIDKLDPRIGIRPRGKTSAEVQFVLLSEFSGPSKPSFPPAMLIIIHQFMVANQFVSSRRHLGGTEKKSLWKSLLVRLDLHETYDLSRQQKQNLSRAAARLNVYVDIQSREWLAAGIYRRPSRKQCPVFHQCTQAWLRWDWDGVIMCPTQKTVIEPAMHTTSVPSECDKAKIEERVSSFISLVSKQRTHGRAEAANVTNEQDETRQASTTSRKRRASDGADAPATQRYRERIRARANRLPKSPLSVPVEDADIEVVRPDDNGFPKILDVIRHAHHTLEELAPKSAKDLAALQQDWADHGFPFSLTESLFVAQSYTSSMKSYLDNTLELLILLEDCTSWKVEGEKFEVELEYEESAMKSIPLRTSGSSESVSSLVNEKTSKGSNTGSDPSKS